MKKMLLLWTVTMLFVGCDDPECLSMMDGTVEGDSGIPGEVGGFTDPKSVQASPLISRALKAAGFKTHDGGSPPDLVGVYTGNGEVLKVSRTGVGLVGYKASRIHHFCTFQQADTRPYYYLDLSTINQGSYRGRLVTGKGDDFTIWHEYVEPNKGGACRVRGIHIWSGTKLASGDLDTRDLWVVLQTNGHSTCNVAPGDWALSREELKREPGTAKCVFY